MICRISRRLLFLVISKCFLDSLSLLHDQERQLCGSDSTLRVLGIEAMVWIPEVVTESNASSNERHTGFTGGKQSTAQSQCIHPLMTKFMSCGPSCERGKCNFFSFTRRTSVLIAVVVFLVCTSPNLFQL